MKLELEITADELHTLVYVATGILAGKPTKDERLMAERLVKEANLLLNTGTDNFIAAYEHAYPREE